MKKNEILSVIQDAFNALHEAEMIIEKVNVIPDTVLLGMGSILDSIGFITLFSEIEDRISEASDKEIYLVLSEIHEFNPDKNILNVEILIEYILNTFFVNAK